jgi:fibronectin-binding autotransporter adhesin
MKFKQSIFLFSTFISVTLSADAVTETKASTGTDLAAGASWADTTAPTTADPAIINWTGTSLGTGLTLGSATTWYGMSVQGSANAAIGITGAGSLTLGSGGIMVESAGVNTSIANNIALGSVQTWSAASGKTLTVSGVVSGSAPLVIGAASQTTQTFLTGTAQTLFTGTSLNNLIATGGMMGGAFVGGTNNVLGGGYLLSNSGSSANYWLEASDGGFIKGVRIELAQSGADITARATAAKFTTGSLGFDFNSGGSAGTLATSDAASGYGAHTTTLITQSSAYSGMVSFSGNNTFSGGLIVAGGTLTGSTGVAFDGTQGGAFGTGAITVNAGATVTTGGSFLIGGSATSRVVNLNGGTLNLQGAGAGGEYIRSLNMTGGTLNNTSGSVFFRTVSAGLALNSLAAATSSTITTGIDMTFGNMAVNTANGAAANDLVISGVISQNTGAGSGNKALTKDGAGTLLLSGANTYAGGTTVNGGTLTGSAGVLFESTQGGSFGTGGITVNSGATLTSSATFVIGGGQNTTRVLNLNGGTLDLKGASIGGEYIRTINLTGGTVLTSDGGSGGATSDWFRAPNGGLSLNSLASSTTSTISTRFDLTLGSLAVDVANGSAANDLIISGNITENTDAGSGARTLTKSGAGTLELTGTNTYSGATTVSAGTLLITGALGNTAVSVANDAVLGGTGTVGGNVSFGGNSFLQIVNLADALTVTGTVTFGSGFGINNIVGLDWDSLTLNQSYTLLSTTTIFDDSLIENFGIANKLAVGTDRYAYFQNGSLAVVVVPEPAAALLGGLGLLSLLRRRRA